MPEPTIRDRAAIVGIGQTRFAKSLGASEYEMAVEAIWNACADAGLSPRDVDGVIRYDVEQIDEEQLLAVLGNPTLRFFAASAWGGGGSASVLVLAAAAITAGLAKTVLVYRSRMISDPLRLFDCNIETDGAVALLVTSAERARDLRHTPAIIHAGAMAAGSHHIRLSNLFARDPREESAPRVAEQLFAMADCTRADIDVAFFYDFFTSLVIIALEQYGFAPRGQGGPFVEDGGLAWPNGRLVCNTNGGQLSEAFVHGFNNSVEAVRQIRGTSTAQIEGCELAFVVGANTDPSGAVILRRP